MTYDAELRRADYSGPGVARTANGDTQSNITVMELKVTDLQKTLVQKVYITERVNNPSSYLHDKGQTQRRVVIKGVFSDEGSVDAGYLEDDLDYAHRWWFIKGILTLVYTHGGLTRSFTGYLEKSSSKETSGEEAIYDFDLTFVTGNKRS